MKPAPEAQAALPFKESLPESKEFDGKTFEPKKDGTRLRKQLDAVRDLMADGRWRTLGEIAEKLGYPEASISARLRDLRKVKFGGCTVERQRRHEQGLFEYRTVFVFKREVKA